MMDEILFKLRILNKIKCYSETIKVHPHIKTYIKANIPKEFWHISLDNFDGDVKAMRLVEKYCANMAEARKNGFGFLFMGENGVGKTSLGIIILKEAIAKGYRAFYISMPEIFKQIYIGFKHVEVLAELKRILYNTDFLFIGELGKDHHRQGSELFMISEFDSIFRERRGDLRPIIMDTNFDEVSLQETYGQSLISLFKSRLKMITVKGGDYRKKSQEKEVERFFRK